MHRIRSRWTLVPAALMIFGGPAALLSLLDVPWIRRSAWAVCTLAAAGGVLALAHAYARRGAVAWIAGVVLAAAGGFVAFAVTAGVRIPLHEGVPSIGDRIPDAALEAADGSKTTVLALFEHRPGLLVFFRGTW